MDINIPGTRLNVLTINVNFIKSKTMRTRIKMFSQRHPFRARDQGNQNFLDFAQVISTRIRLTNNVYRVHSNSIHTLQDNRLMLMCNFRHVIVSLFSNIISTLNMATYTSPLHTIMAITYATVIINRHTRHNRHKPTRRRFATIGHMQGGTTLHAQRRGLAAKSLRTDVPATGNRGTIGELHLTNDGQLKTYGRDLTRQRLMTLQHPLFHNNGTLTRFRHRLINLTSMNLRQPFGVRILNFTDQRVGALFNLPCQLTVHGRTHGRRVINNKGRRVIVHSLGTNFAQRGTRINVRLLSILHL